MNGLLNREFRAWNTRLEGAIEKVQALGSFIQRPGRIIVPDTSAFMEGVFFADFDWHTLDATLKDSRVRLIVRPWSLRN
jgi:hypothetical protein